MNEQTKTAVSESRPFRIAVFPTGVTQWDLPYFRLLHAALAEHGIVAADDLVFDRSWLKAHAGEVDAVHVHWPERIWHRDGFGRLGRLSRAAVATRRLLDLRGVLRTARRLGMRSIWTVHNLEPHEGAFRWDRFGYRIIAREADLVICHSHDALDAVRRLYPPGGQAIVMPMGDQSGEYPAPQPRARVLREVGLDPALPAVCCLGRMRHYKGIELACEAIAHLQGRVQLIIGGPPHPGYDVTPVSELAGQIRGVALLPRRLTPQEYADLMGASEAMLLPYRQITGSAAMLSAFGCGRGVIASDLPFFREVLSAEPDAGVLVGTRAPTDWADSILGYIGRQRQTRTDAALRLARCYSWSRCVEPLVAALRETRPRPMRFNVNAVHA